MKPSVLRKRTAGACLLLFLCAPILPASAVETPADLVVTAQVRPNLFGTVAIPGPAGRWGDKWHRIRTDEGSDPSLKALVAPARGLARLAQLRHIQAAVDRRIGWRSDGTQYGARIYWASASETLASGLGDDDDRAILKYQALRALGFPAQDYYLMMGRDRVRGDYVMLVARADGRWWLLEEQGDVPVPAEGRQGFEPMASFGASRTFIHGRPRRSVEVAATLASASASTGGTSP